MKAIDERLQKLAALAPIIGVTGDHGMSQKSNAAGEPNVLFLEDRLNEKFGASASRVICPITDPFVRHHGALGSFVRVYLKDLTRLTSMLAYCKSLPQVEVAVSGKTAAETYDMPLDREADIVVISKPDAVIGSRKSEHDLSKVKDHPLRSHGGLSEQDIPVIVSKPVHIPEKAQTRNWKNYDIFDLVLNGSS
jgi:phosphonoacetate hydrolase